ncbi:hypothetical protein VOLCADRAFT_105715 [Volvox carteri f. nagariensis]|uniref:Reticulon-like protein n=1 Tax=Volvox carteri f. nagariensis TaxID=3068 RepID=D8U2J0_VOLCA|nr:uncharacterized protein VOLCADRAFT_105715 [Volvox carteri f. nagariensis]EFJ46145.1 hypothetical protein VOLCADRAFT_105715 [Volvox carteri f. nagariensis]|eukprot:XP_002952895.1 hypothetical protein VOLCADRAFT_105715 [Volvox carteri f. nagariensis]
MNMADYDLPAKDATEKVLDNPSKLVSSDSPLPDTLKQEASEMKTAFGSPHPDPVPDVPEAPAASPVVNPAKQLDFNVNPPTPATPVMMASTAGDELDYNAFITETLLWTNKVRSSFYFICGLLAWLVVRAVFTSPITLFTGLCYTLLFSLGFNFLRGAFAPRYQERCTWANSSLTQLLISVVTGAIRVAASLHDRHLHGLDPLRTLEVGMALWILSVLGRALDAVTLLLLLHLGAFTLPLGYKVYKKRIDTIVADVYGKVHAQYEKFDRRVRAAMVLVPMATMFILLPNVDRFVAIFICLAYGRVLAKPDEFATFQKRIEPVGKTIKKTVFTPVTSAAANAMSKYDLTPTPRKKKAI